MLNFLGPETRRVGCVSEILLVLAGPWLRAASCSLLQIAGPRHAERQRAHVARRVGVMENCPGTGAGGLQRAASDWLASFCELACTTF